MDANAPAEPATTPPCPFDSGATLIAKADAVALSVAELMLANELTLRDEATVLTGLDRIFADMEACIERGMRVDGVLPGGLNVRRRAKQVRDGLLARAGEDMKEIYRETSLGGLAVSAIEC